MNGAIETMTTTAQLVPLIANLPAAEIGSQMPKLLQQDYRWFDETNRQEALTHLEGLVVAWRHGLTQQVPPYRIKILEIVTKDMAQATMSFVTHQLGYQSFYYFYPFGFLEHRAFSISLQRGPGAQAQQLQFVPIHQYPEFIPPHILRTLSIVESGGFIAEYLWIAAPAIVPNPIWIAPPPRTRDPILCASFSRWFVALAEWQ